ncbi:LysR family transcriptional regulator [Rahnella inusitata]|uniref:LysR family transcriptional regulator n=1 Tax=Rahnella inusitata TaxID=58169 RepID=UPI001BC852D5|nr:LysR family transcriptional regulator [Rahnella inusitata]QUT14186.1 LysR family transcriptional regulator [Rahnella inusitata]
MNERKINEFDYNLIKIMNEVIVSGSLSRAADKLELSVSAVSLSINKLQRYIGVELFIRTAQGMKPTQTALDIHDSFSHAMCIIDDVVHKAKNHEKSVSTVRVMCSDLVESFYFQRLHQRDDLQETLFVFTNATLFNHDECVRNLLQSGNDIVLSNFPLNHSSITSVEIDSVDNFVVVCSDTSLLASQKAFTLSHYYTLPHAVYCHSEGQVKKLISVNNQHMPNNKSNMRKVVYNSSSLNGIIAAIERSDMIAIFPTKVAEYFIDKRHSKLATFSLPDDIHHETLKTYANFVTRTTKIRGINHIISSFKAVENCQ